MYSSKGLLPRYYMPGPRPAETVQPSEGHKGVKIGTLLGEDFLNDLPVGIQVVLQNCGNGSNTVMLSYILGQQRQVAEEGVSPQHSEGADRHSHPYHTRFFALHRYGLVKGQKVVARNVSILHLIVPREQVDVVGSEYPGIWVNRSSLFALFTSTFSSFLTWSHLAMTACGGQRSVIGMVVSQSAFNSIEDEMDVNEVTMLHVNKVAKLMMAIGLGPAVTQWCDWCADFWEQHSSHLQ
ncbi:hypothetical protein PILCRDRAFT_93420 [Piloderma croceum F 1598]|uniref:Uncharacterized protein n=1 Tax=Piloderma croceum (strain F 1598) TaxID=765440 RepID=A0A0C3EIV1_PILCF|nr:hypothetical protein PILCRDRAFT_93420 [Piloderma croceum F 1598]